MLILQRIVLVLLWLSINSNAHPVPAADNSGTEIKSDNGKNGRECRKGAVDLAFVIDESGSISGEHFNQTLSFLANLTRTMDIGSAVEQNQVALVKFADSATLVFNLNRHHEKNQLLSEIVKVTQRSGGTDIASGMDLATNWVFTAAGDDRSDVQNMILVLTDGQDTSDVVRAHKAAAAKNITVYIIGIGNAVNNSQLAAVAGGNLAHVYNISGFDALESLNNQICIGTLGASGFPWLSVLPALIAVPLAIIILAAVFLTVVHLRKRRKRNQIIGSHETTLLTSEAGEQGDVKTQDNLRPQLRPTPPSKANKWNPVTHPPKPPSSDTKWNTVDTEKTGDSADESTENTQTTAIVHHKPTHSKRPDLQTSTATQLNGGAVKPLLPPRKPILDAGRVGEAETEKKSNAYKMDYQAFEFPSSTPRYASLPPTSEKPQKDIGQVNCPNSSKNGYIHIAENEYLHSPPLTEATPPTGENSREADIFHSQNSDMDSKSRIADKRPLLPPPAPPSNAKKPQKVDQTDRENPHAEDGIKLAKTKQLPSTPSYVVPTLSADASGMADQFHRQNLENDDKIKSAEREQALSQPGGNKTDSSKTADRFHSHDSNTDADTKTAALRQTPLTSSPTTEVSQQADRIFHPDSNADVKGKNADRKALQPPNSEQSRNGDRYHLPDSSVDANIQTGARKQAKLPAPLIASRLASFKQPSNNESDGYSSIQKDKSKTAQKAQNESSRTNAIQRNKTPNKKEPTWIETAGDDVDVSKTAVVYRKEVPNAFENGRIPSSDVILSHESVDLSKSAALIRHEQGTAPSVFLDSNVSIGADEQPKIAEIVQQESGSSFRVKSG